MKPLKRPSCAIPTSPPPPGCPQQDASILPPCCLSQMKPLKRHRLRPHIIPRRESCPPKPRQLPLFADTAGLVPLRSAFQLPPVREPRRLSWARLLARVFSIDVTICQRCQGPMRILQAVTHPDEIARLLHRARAPPRPSPPGQQPLFAARPRTKPSFTELGHGTRAPVDRRPANPAVPAGPRPTPAPSL